MNCDRIALACVVAIALNFVAPRAARAQSISYTDYNAPSGFVTCNGVNADGTTATWTAGGSIEYIKDTGSEFGFYDYQGSANLNVDPNPKSYSVEARIYTSGNLEANCPRIDGSLKLNYYSYPMQANQVVIAGYYWDDPDANDNRQLPYSFATLTNAVDVIYIVTSGQSSKGTSWYAQTPYL
ncbi:MAG TPA: hypothetical protein VFJ58_17125 [Armatimonadota bacterium]|nr:hypothetical protein [Armatimonadota bacterium]